MGVGATKGVPVATLLEGLSVECYGLLCQKVVLRVLSDRLFFLVFRLCIYLFLWGWVAKKLVSLWLNRVAIRESSFLEWKLIKRSTHLSKVG